MGLFSKKKEEPIAHPIRSLHPLVHQQLVAVSFNHVRKDVHNIYEWIRYLHQQNKTQQEMIHHLSRQIQNHGMHREVQERQSSAHIQELRSRLLEVEKNISRLSKQDQAPSPRGAAQLSEIMGRAAQKPSSQVISSLQEKVIKKVQQNSKEYIKNVIHQLIGKYARISGLHLREIVVDEQALCSRSSFYRLLGELEDEGNVKVAASGKEKVYSFADGISSLVPEVQGSLRSLNRT